MKQCRTFDSMVVFFIINLSLLFQEFPGEPSFVLYHMRLAIAALELRLYYLAQSQTSYIVTVFYLRFIFFDIHYFSN